MSMNILVYRNKAQPASSVCPAILREVMKKSANAEGTFSGHSGGFIPPVSESDAQRMVNARYRFLSIRIEFTCYGQKRVEVPWGHVRILFKGLMICMIRNFREP